MQLGGVLRIRFPVTEYMRAWPSGAPVRAMTESLGGRLCHMNSVFTPNTCDKFAPAPTTKFAPVLAKFPMSPTMNPGPPPMLKVYLGSSTWAETATLSKIKAANKTTSSLVCRILLDVVDGSGAGDGFTRNLLI